MIELAIVDPEGGEPTQKSNKFNDPRRKHVSLLLVANRTEDKKGMDLSWNMHFSKKSKDRHKCTRTVETTIVHPTDNSKNLTQSKTSKQTTKKGTTNLLLFFLFFYIVYCDQSMSMCSHKNTTCMRYIISLCFQH